jgi:hypothetical protein
MTDIEKLTFLRKELVAGGRSPVVSLQKVAPEPLSREAIWRIQNAIETVTRAIEEHTPQMNISSPVDRAFKRST